MNKEIQSIIRNFQDVTYKEPWYGRSVFALLEDVDPAKAGKKITEDAHSSLEILYHMITWADFTLKRIVGDKEDMETIEKIDWRQIDPEKHTWEKGLAELKTIHEKIFQLLEEKDDEFLKEKVDYRDYKFRYLLNGLMQHNIYHAGQIAYITKYLH